MGIVRSQLFNAQVWLKVSVEDRGFFDKVGEIVPAGGVVVSFGAAERYMNRDSGIVFVKHIDSKCWRYSVWRINLVERCMAKRPSANFSNRRRQS